MSINLSKLLDFMILFSATILLTMAIYSSIITIDLIFYSSYTGSLANKLLFYCTLIVICVWRIWVRINVIWGGKN